MSYPCDKCERGFKTKYELERHLNRKTACNEGTFLCPECRIPFRRQKALDAHIELGRCKGKKESSVIAELEQEVESLNEKVKQQEHILSLTNKASAAAANQININTTNLNLTINVETLGATNAMGKECLKHLVNTDGTKIRPNLAHNPTAFAAWCKLLRADEEHPENHNALLLDKDSELMACCRDGNWTMDNREKILVELLSHDVSRFYDYLGNWEHDTQAKSFRNEYLLHNIMNKTIQRDLKALQPVMDAISEPIVSLTNKFYVEPSEPNLEFPEYIKLQGQVEALADNRNKLQFQLAEQTANMERQLAQQNAIILSMRQDLAEMAKRIVTST